MDVVEQAQEFRRLRQEVSRLNRLLLDQDRRLVAQGDLISGIRRVSASLHLDSMSQQEMRCALAEYQSYCASYGGSTGESVGLFALNQ